ncbi:MAG: hypothetical protein IT372_35410 [Polyangiaceae bacterium]|nr:hypothetical protein [Polyangiaceae bacterium]
MSAPLTRLRRILGVIAADRRLPLAWLAAIFLWLGYYKITMTRLMFDPLPDGGYYMNIATHVRDGQGLTTNICLLHGGCPSMPCPTGIYPLWPLLYGHVARIFPVEPTGKWLATVLYYTSLTFAYLWATALSPRPLFGRILPGVNAGHVLVLMLGLNNEFFRYTSAPYTEGISYAVTLAALWRFHRLFPEPSWKSGLEMGVWLGLASLARYQLLLMTLAAVPVLLGAAAFIRERRKQYALMTVTCLAAYTAIMTVQYLRLRSFTPGLTVSLMYRWDQMRYSDAVSKIPILRETHGLWDYLRDRAAGFPIAFGAGKTSYGPQFYTFQYALIAAVPLLLVMAARRRRWADVLAGWAWIRRPEAVSWVYVVVFALGGFLSVHTMHMHTIASGEWIFPARQALVSAFLFFLALVLLFSRGGIPGRAAGALIVCSSVYLGVLALRAHVEPLRGRRPPVTPEIAKYLNAEKQARGELIVAYRQPQLIARFTPGVNYHWYHRGTSLADVEAMVTKLGADLVTVPARDRPAFARDPRFKQHFELVKSASGVEVYAPGEALLANRRLLRDRAGAPW